MNREDGRNVHHRSGRESECTGAQSKIGALFHLHPETTHSQSNGLGPFTAESPDVQKSMRQLRSVRQVHISTMP
jgi:hypothetical protein